ncbi:hypothetical protein ACFOGI_11385 [Virgibacillus xinjiangensis]|uniref:Uncharacterized protein n=1 Tax=Virgibacillus xinjiangensis TaxID=393090 RepID=A0ABV7CWK9_9BACI
MLNDDLKVIMELKKMLVQHAVPISVRQDIDEQCDQVRKGGKTLAEIKENDPFIGEVIDMARKRTKG